MSKLVMSNVLYCNPAQNDQLELWFGNIHTRDVTERIIQSTQADTLLKSITDLTKGQRIDHIVVVNQARSFTFIRIIVTICNTLSYATGATIHSVDEPIDQIEDVQAILEINSQYIIPYYSQPPNIS